uniref:Peptidase A1 domain-containing protein n=1 Tax=Kalanchoe fedtschenkoi TaxID=63787 RepID=A0A7N0V5D5_KALFE
MSNWIAPNSPTVDLVFHAGEYLMKIHLGTSPDDIIAVADTGSDLTWMQCHPCTRCVPQHQTLFNPRASLSYGRISCSPSRPCPPWNGIECRYGLCHHDIRYADRRKFSYCLNPIGLQDRVSHIHFGDRATVQGPGTVTVPLVPGQMQAYTTSRSRPLQSGGLGLASSAALALSRKATSKDKSLPPSSMVANFRGGDVSLTWYNAFVTTRPVTCLAFGVSEGLTSYGSLAQQDFLVGFDKMAGTLSFKPSDCTHA